jgi:hypothetical protein
MVDLFPIPLAYGGGWQDIAISVGMLVFIGSVAGMLFDEMTTVAPKKAFAYGTAQLTVATANASLGLWLSASLLVVGSGMWYALGYQSGPSTASVSRRDTDRSLSSSKDGQ